ncbi:MAG: ATP-binding protein [Myxococcota bacterium]
MSDPVILALRTALAAQDNIDVRVALGLRLLELGSAKEALTELELVIGKSPTHRGALEGAAKAARAVQDHSKATAYEAVLGAIAGATGIPRQEPEFEEDTPPPSIAATAGGGMRLVASEGELIGDEFAEAGITFEDVAGMEEVKDRLRRSFLNPLKNPELVQRYGMTLGGGLLLYGPPGCGKTHIARAMAGEIGARFISIGLSDVLDMWFGESERKLHELFENARRKAPVVMFFDEVDALGQRRTNLKGAAGRTLVNQFLSEMDGFAKNNAGVFILGATNHPWDLDTAIRRPGRFDRLVLVTPPTLAARKRLFELSLQGRPLGSIDYDRAAKQTEGYSGADIAAIASIAVQLAMEQAMETGKDVPIEDGLLKRAIADVRGSTRPWLETARNYAIYANEGGVYDDLLAYLKKVGLG